MRFIDSLKKHKDNDVILRFIDTETTVTYGMLIANSAKWALWMKERQIGSLGLQMGNCPEFVYLFTAALRLGIKTYTFSVLREAEDYDECFLIYDGNNPKITKPHGIDVHGIDVNETKTDTFTEYDWSLDEDLFYLETSGTSGKRTRIANALNKYGASEEAGVKKISRIIKIKFANVFQWYHTAGLTNLMLLLIGTFPFAMNTLGNFNPLTVKRYLSRETPTIIVCTGTMLYRICKADNTPPRIPKIAIFGSEAVSADKVRYFSQLDNFGLLSLGYGSTEVGGVSKYLCVSKKTPLWMRLGVKAANKLGKLCAYDAQNIPEHYAGRVHSDTVVEVRNQDSNGIGEIWVKKKLSHNDGKDVFVFPGDIGYLKGNDLYLMGRFSSVINRSGEKILPTDITDKVKKIATVNDAVVFGIQSDTHGEGICLCIEGTATQEEIRSVLPKYMWPQEIHCFDEFPINGSGKVDPRQYLLSQCDK